MATARNIPTAFPELDYGEPPRDKEPRRSRSRSLRSVANLVLGKQATKASPNETNSPASTTRWPSISALRRSQKNALPPPSEVTTTSAGNGSANAELYTRDRRSADIPRRRFSLSRPIRLSLNLARPTKRGAPEVESLISEVAPSGHDEGRQDTDAYTHSHELRRRLEELEADGASTQVLAGDASSRAAGSVELSLLEGDGGEASLLESDGGEASSHEVDGGEASSLEFDGDGPSLLELDGVEPSLLELDAAPSQLEVEVSSSEVEGDIDSVHDATGPSLVEAQDSLLNIDAAVLDIDAAAPGTDAVVYAADGKPSHASAFEDDIEQVGSAKGRSTSPHVAFAEDVVEYGPGLPELVHSCYKDGDFTDVYADIDEEAYHAGEDGYPGDEDGYHGDDELLYSSDDEDFYAYPSNAIFDVSSHTPSPASADALNHISTSALAYAPTLEAPATNITAVMSLTSRPVAIPFTSRPVAIPFTSRPAAIPFTSRAPAAILPPAAPPVPDDAYETHTPQYAAFFSESPSSYDVAMDFLPLSDLEGTPVDEAGASFGESALSCESALFGESAVDGSDSEGQADLIFPDEASFPVIYETREARKEGGQAWEEGEMTLWSSELSLAPSLETPSDPVLGPLLSEERGVWRDDEATPLPPFRMDRLPWLEESDEEESPLSPMDGQDSLLSPPSLLGAELPILMADSLPLAADNEEVDGESKDSVAGGDADENADFALFPTDPRSLPYLLRLSAEYDGTPASELNGSPFPSPIPRTPFDENVLPFASLSAQEIATGHQLVRRGREGVVARRVMVERQPSQALVDTTAQAENTTQVESMAQIDPTLQIDFTASSPLDAFLPQVHTPAFAPELLDLFPPPSPHMEMSGGMQFSESRALVRRPTEGDMAVVRAESCSNSLSSMTAEPISFSTILEKAYASPSSAGLPIDRPRRPTLTAMQSALLPRVEPLVLDVRDANNMVMPSPFFSVQGERRPTTLNQSAEVVNRFPADMVLHQPIAALALDTPQLAMLYSPLDTAVLYSPSPLGTVPSPSYFASLRYPLGAATSPFASPLGSIATDVDPFELAVAVRAPRTVAVMIRDTALEGSDSAAGIEQTPLPFTAFLPDDYVLPEDVDEEPLPFPGLPSWELAVQMQAHYIEPKLPRALEAMLGDDDSADGAHALAASSPPSYTLPSVPSTLEAMVLGTAKASLVSVQPRSLVSNLIGLGSGGGISPAVAPKSVNSQGTDVDLAEKLAVDAHDIVFIDAESEDPLAPSTSAAHSADPAIKLDGPLHETKGSQGKQAASPLGELPLPDMDFASTMVSAVEGLWNGA